MKVCINLSYASASFPWVCLLWRLMHVSERLCVLFVFQCGDDGPSRSVPRVWRQAVGASAARGCGEQAAQPIPGHLHCEFIFLFCITLLLFFFFYSNDVHRDSYSGCSYNHDIKKNSFCFFGLKFERENERLVKEWTFIAAITWKKWYFMLYIKM